MPKITATLPVIGAGEKAGSSAKAMRKWLYRTWLSPKFGFYRHFGAAAKQVVNRFRERRVNSRTKADQPRKAAAILNTR